MRRLFPFLFLVLSGCLSSDVSRWDEFGGLLNRDLKTQRPTAFLFRAQHMKSIWFGGWVDVYYLEEKEGNYTTKIPLPAGTSLMIKRLERRNLVDSGIEILAFGTLRRPDTGEEVEFIYELTADLGRQIRRAPWDDESVPALKPARGSEWVDIHVAPPGPIKKEPKQSPEPTVPSGRGSP